MTKEERAKVLLLAESGLGYHKISNELNINEQTVKSFLRRRGITKKGTALQNGTKGLDYIVCRNCGTELKQTPKHRRKLFCSDDCRRVWWKEHPEEIQRKTTYPHICAACGIHFESQRENSIFCSRACYADYRRKGENKNGEEKATQIHKTEINATGQTGNSLYQSASNDQRADTGREEFSAVPPHHSCDECPWFNFGQRFVESYGLLREAIQTADRKPEICKEEE